MDENEIDMKPIERMADSLRRGNIWIWILKLLNEEDKYAYQLRKEINDKFGFDPATVTAYAVLYRLEKSEFVEEASNEFFPNRKYATTMPAMSAAYKGAGHGTIKPMVTADTKRIPRKPGQKAKSDKHSDLYTDEDPKGTIHGLGFTDRAKAKQSVSKIRGSDRTHAHKMQAAIAMSQRAKVASQRAKDPEKKKNLGQAHKIYQNYIDTNKKGK